MKADVDPRPWDGDDGDTRPASAWEGLEVLVLSPTPTHPLDAGNRRRIFHLTQALRRQGARIVFAHYPGEADWRGRLPRASLAAMHAQWDEVHTIPVTRPLHVAAAPGADHGIDDWWDPAIGDMLRWIFETHHIDVCLVNYTWLSRAFEYCPPGVLKILDTHDRFSGRRELLERHGIAPEFFHTTREAEQAGLLRADVVWSIKPQEAAFFRDLGIARVINMPHVEMRHVEPGFPAAGETVAGNTGAARPRGKGGIIRFGIIGARNSINRANIAAFLDAAARYVARTLLPCEIVVAGGVCDLLAEDAGPAPWRGLPWIRLLGRVADLVAFYRDIDVVLAPITFSTGLKIKVGEALCQGKAVLALAHAFEGFPPQHPFHVLDSTAAMLDACRDLVNDPGQIDALERCSLIAVRQTRAEVARGLARTITTPLCLVARLDAIFDGSLVLDHVLETAHYLSHLAALSVFIDVPPPEPSPAETSMNTPADREALLALLAIGPVLLPPALFGGAVGTMLREAGARGLRCLTLEELIGGAPVALWFASIPASPVSASPTHASPTRAYAALDTLALHATPARIQDFLARAAAIFATTVTVSRRGFVGPGCSATMLEHRVPVFWKGERGRVLAALANHHEGEDATPCEKTVVVLADAADEPLLALTVALVLRLSPHAARIVLPGAIPATLPDSWTVDPGTVDPGTVDPGRVELVSAARCFAALSRRPGVARDIVLVLDIATDPVLECLREAFDRAPVPCASLFAGGAGPAHGRWAEPSGARGVYESVSAIQRLLTEPGHATGQDSGDDVAVTAAPRGSYRHDAGWALIWDEIKELIAAANQPPPPAGHFGAGMEKQELLF